MCVCVMHAGHAFGNLEVNNICSDDEPSPKCAVSFPNTADCTTGEFGRCSPFGRGPPCCSDCFLGKWRRGRNNRCWHRRICSPCSSSPSLNLSISYSPSRNSSPSTNSSSGPSTTTITGPCISSCCSHA